MTGQDEAAGHSLLPGVPWAAPEDCDSLRHLVPLSEVQLPPKPQELGALQWIERPEGAAGRPGRGGSIASKGGTLALKRHKGQWP